jgi:hypothetical protein
MFTFVTPEGATQEFVPVLIFKMQRPDAEASVTSVVDASAVVQGPAIAAGIGAAIDNVKDPNKDQIKTL